jgi:hypothetical protein
MDKTGSTAIATNHPSPAMKDVCIKNASATAHVPWHRSLVLRESRLYTNSRAMQKSQAILFITILDKWDLSLRYLQNRSNTTNKQHNEMTESNKRMNSPVL